MKIGVLAVQGAFIEQEMKLYACLENFIQKQLTIPPTCGII